MRRSALPFLAALAVAIAAACARFKPSGYSPDTRLGLSGKVPQGYEVDPSSHPAKLRPEDVLPRDLSAKQRRALYYSDLGPDTVDVSSYPPRQRLNYAVYAAACSSCHSLARSINAPPVGRRFWNLYMLGMRFNTRFYGKERLSPEDREAILDFLAYDSNVRKLERRAEFEALQDELIRRFRTLIDERLQKMQDQGRPALPPDPWGPPE